MGSKARFATEIIAITCANRWPGQVYVEPFVGGGNVICRVPANQGPRIGADINQYMVALLDALGNRGWLPPETMSEKEWTHIKQNQNKYPDELVAFAATGCVFGAKWFGVWARIPGTNRCFYRESRDNALRDIEGLVGVQFQCINYRHLSIPSQSIVYCDPPYANTASYAGAKTDIAVGQDLSINTWDRTAFWRWADQMVEAGHRVYVSEYAGPPAGIYGGTSPRREAAAARFRALQADQQSTREAREAAAAEMRAIQAEERAEAARLAARWACVWEKDVVSSFDSGRGTEAKREVEKLFHRAP